MRPDLGNEYATRMLNDVVVELLTCYRYEGSWPMDMKYGDKRSDSAKVTELKVAARIINVEKFSRNYEIFAQMIKKCSSCGFEMTQYEEKRDGAVDCYCYKCSYCAQDIENPKPTSSEKLKVRPDSGLSNGGDEDYRYRVVDYRKQDEPEYKVITLSSKSSTDQNENSEGVEGKWLTTEEINEKEGIKKVIKERKKELEVMTFLLRPRHVLYTHPRKVKFNDEDLNKIFKPMEVKANVENDELSRKNKCEK